MGKSVGPGGTGLVLSSGSAPSEALSDSSLGQPRPHRSGRGSSRRGRGSRQVPSGAWRTVSRVDQGRCGLALDVTSTPLDPSLQRCL